MSGDNPHQIWFYVRWWLGERKQDPMLVLEQSEPTKSMDNYQLRQDAVKVWRDLSPQRKPERMKGTHATEEIRFSMPDHQATSFLKPAKETPEEPLL